MAGGYVFLVAQMGLSIMIGSLAALTCEKARLISTNGARKGSEAVDITVEVWLWAREARRSDRRAGREGNSS